MTTVFTEFIRSLEPGVEPDADLFERTWDTLRAAVCGEIKKRGLWEAPPSYFGICGRRNWWDQDALVELLHECYVFVFVDRLRALKNQLKIKENVDGLVFRNVRNCLDDLQRNHDPLSARVFRILRKSVRRLVEAGGILVLSGDARIRGDTCLGFVPDGDCSNTRTAALDEHVPIWCDDLLPDLVTAVGRGVAKVLEQLQELVSRLNRQGFETLLFRDVLRPLGHEVKRRCGMRWHSPGEEIGTEGDPAEDELVAVIKVRPEHDFEERERIRYLIRLVAQGTERVAKTRKTRGHLLVYWRFLVDQSQQDPDTKIPSDTQVGKQLGIPRERLPELRSLLGELIGDCESHRSGKLLVNQ